MTEIPLNAEALRKATEAYLADPIRTNCDCDLAIPTAICTYLAASGVQAVVEAARELKRLQGSGGFECFHAEDTLFDAVAALKESPDAN